MPSFPRARVIRVLIADDDRTFAEGLMLALTQGEEIDVVGIAENGEQAVELARRLRPHVVVMDIRMPVSDGLAATRRIREAGLDTQIVVVSATEDETGSKLSAEAGANAFMRKGVDLEQLKHVVLEVAAPSAALGAKDIA
jgi:DNA-binding NarL/FixJ family response regulator